MSFFSKWRGSDPEARCEEGLAALGRRDFHAAAKAFQACVDASRRASTIRIARFHLAECHTRFAEDAWRDGRYDAAHDEIELALTCTKPTAERHLVGAQIARRLGRREDEMYHLEAALAQTPDHEQARALRTLAWYEEGRTEEALASAETLPPVDGRLRRFREAHERGDRKTAEGHLLAVATGYPQSLL